MSPINYLLAARALTTPSPSAAASALPAATSATPSSDDSPNLPQWVGPIAWVFFALALLLIFYTGAKSLRKSLTAEKTLEEKIINSPPKRTSTSSETTLVDAQPKPRISRLAPPSPAYIARVSQSMPMKEGALYRLTGENTWHNKLASQRAVAEADASLPPILRPKERIRLVVVGDQSSNTHVEQTTLRMYYQHEGSHVMLSLRAPGTPRLKRSLAIPSHTYGTLYLALEPWINNPNNVLSTYYTPFKIGKRLGIITAKRNQTPVGAKLVEATANGSWFNIANPITLPAPRPLQPGNPMLPS
ncbi:hypothetical protein DFH06DRAFT_1145959 [Mycena polygramma]|nr:hypothetical protein DFH06DRAFT_1145959 [Mycena polygramma]